MKELFNKIKSFVAKNGKILAIIATIIVVVVVICLIVFRKRDEKFALNHIYDVYPEEVRALYANMVDVSCTGDLRLNIDLDGGIRKVKDIDNNNMADYLFSYLDKQGALEEKTNLHVVEEAAKKLFNEKFELNNNKYTYGEYEYTLKGNTFVRSTDKIECAVDNKQVLHLYGYFWKENKLSVDVNVAYLKNGILYNYDDKELGAYDGDVSKLQKLTEDTSYYRFNFIKNGGYYKLDSVEWKRRT